MGFTSNTATRRAPAVVARTPAEIRGCLHGLREMERHGWLKNPRRVIGRMSEQLAVTEAELNAERDDLDYAEDQPKPEPVRTREGTQLTEEELREELRDRNLRPSPDRKEHL